MHNKYRIEYLDKDLDGIIITEEPNKSNKTIKIKFPFTEVGQEVTLTKIEKVHKDIYICKDPINYSKERSICKYFTVCGGCKAQHLSNDTYSSHKIEMLKKALSFQGITLEKEVVFHHHLDDPYFKRRRATLRVGKSSFIGFNGYKSNDIIQIEECPLLTSGINKVIKIFNTTYTKDTLSIINKILISDIEGKLDIAIDGKLKLSNNLLKDLSLLSSYNFINKVSYKYKKNDDVIFYKEDIKVTYNETSVKFPSGSFLQPSQWGELTIKNIIYSKLSNNKNILDLFCGLGSYSFYLFNNNNYNVSMYDIEEKAIKSINDAKNSKSIKANVRNLFESPIPSEELNNFDTVIINPPREGCLNQVKELANSEKINSIFMVYCDFISLSKDIKILLDKGFIIESLDIVDQFIYSNNMEVLVYLSKNL